MIPARPRALLPLDALCAANPLFACEWQSWCRANKCFRATMGDLKRALDDAPVPTEARLLWDDETWQKPGS